MQYERELTPEQQEKLNNCKTPEEVAQFIEEESQKLSEEDLSQIVGGKEGWHWELVKIGFVTRWVLRKNSDKQDW